MDGKVLKYEIKKISEFLNYYFVFFYFDRSLKVFYYFEFTLSFV